MKLIKDDEKGKVYEGNDLKVFYRKEGSVSGDNDINDYEKIYLVQGEVELTIGDDTQNLVAPAEFEIPANFYHKIVALTDITFILLNN